MAYQPKLSETLPFLDELPDAVVKRAAELAGLRSAKALRSHAATLPEVPRLAEAIATACLEDPARSLEQTSVGVLIPSRVDTAGTPASTSAPVRLVSVYGLPELGGLSTQHLLAWLVELAIRSKSVVPRGRNSGDRPGREDEVVPDLPQTADSVLEALREIAAWAYLEHGQRSPVAALQSPPPGPMPHAVKRALAVLEAASTSAWAFEGYGRYDLAQAFADLEETVGPRGWQVFAERRLAPDARPTLEALGQRLGITRERVRQLERQARDKVLEITSSPEASVIGRAAERVHTALGEVGHASEVQRALKAVDPRGEALPGHPERSRLILDLAGPFRQADEWIVRGDIDTRAALALAEATEDGPITVADARSRLHELGVRSEVSQDWLDSLLGFRVLEDSVVRWDGTLADKAEAILRVAAEPMTVAEVFEALGEDRSVRTLSNYLQSDARFMRRGLEHYGLREWGGEEYTTIVQEIQEEIERQGGEATLEHLVATLTAAFGVSENSVRTYAQQHPLFAQTNRGTICLREGETHAPATHRTLEETRGCFRLRDGWAVRLAVTFDTLRGSGTPIPTPLAEHIGLAPRTSREFETQWGVIYAGWPSIQPQIGSQRRGAEALGLNEGDLLLIEFVGDEARFHGVRRESLEEVAGLERLAREMGAPLADTDPVGWICRALGVDESDGDAPAAVRRRLLARRELDLAALVPEAELTQADEDLLGLLASLGE